MYEILQHTADVRLHVTASTLEELFADALRGLMEVMGGAAASDTRTEQVELESVDVTALLVDFLNEALVRAHVQRRSFTGASFATLTETHAAATLTSVPAEFEEDVKAVTYHEAEVRRGENGWTTMLVLDI
ncbi:MAG TPA: archease [Thermoanaerobaculia bacterium]|nr:archease [Thermoanaerobaculia bacterium]